MKNKDIKSMKDELKKLQEALTQVAKYQMDEPDQEGEMARAQMLKTMKYAADIMNMIDDSTNLPAWVQSKLTKIAEYIGAVKHYMDSKTVRHVVTNMMETKEPSLKLKDILSESVVSEARKSKDTAGIRYVEAIDNNINSIHSLVLRNKKQPQEVMSAFGTPLVNSIKAALNHNYKPANAEDAPFLEGFKSELKKLLTLAESLVKRPSNAGVKKLDELWTFIWNRRGGGNIALNGKYQDSIIESTINESVSSSELQKIKKAIEKVTGKNFFIDRNYHTRNYEFLSTDDNNEAVVIVGSGEDNAEDSKYVWAIASGVNQYDNGMGDNFSKVLSDIVKAVQKRKKLFESAINERKPSKIVWDTKKISDAKRINVKKWYMKTYPTDELGGEIDKRISLWDVYEYLSQGRDAYKIIGVGDSVVRERIFEKLSKVLGVDYDTIYNMWESVNEEIKVGSSVTVNYPTLRKPIKGKVKHILKMPKGLVYVLNDPNGVWDEKWVSKNESVVNEGAGKEAMGIAALTGTRGDAVQKFIDTHEIDARKVFNFLKKGKLSDRMDFVTALSGKPDNPIQQKMVKMFRESVVNEGPSSQELRMAKNAIKSFAKYRNVSDSDAYYDLMSALKSLEKQYESLINQQLS